MRKCGCEYHLKMQELVDALHNWHSMVHKKIKTQYPNHSCNACCRPEYFSCTKNLSSFGDHLCPCGREDTGLRKLRCSKGECDECKDPQSNFLVCSAEKEFHDLLVKYRWMRFVQIGTHQSTEWARFQKPMSSSNSFSSTTTKIPIDYIITSTSIKTARDVSVEIG